MLSLENLLMDYEGFKNGYKIDITEFQCPVTISGSNKLGEEVCNLKNTVIEHDIEIDAINALLEVQNGINAEQSYQIDKNMQDITDLINKVNHLNDIFGHSTRCSKSAIEELSPTRPDTGKFSGNCGSGLFPPSNSGCSWSCKHKSDWVTCAHVKCNENGHWGVSSGNLCCIPPAQWSDGGCC